MAKLFIWPKNIFVKFQWIFLYSVYFKDSSESCNFDVLKDAMTELIKPMRFVDILEDDYGLHENEFIFQLILSYRAMIQSILHDGKFGGEVGTGTDEIVERPEPPQQQQNVYVAKAKKARGIRGKFKKLMGKDEKERAKRADTVYSLGTVAIIIETKHDQTKNPSINSGDKMAEKGLKQVCALINA